MTPVMTFIQLNRPLDLCPKCEVNMEKHYILAAIPQDKINT